MTGRRQNRQGTATGRRSKSIPVIDNVGALSDAPERGADKLSLGAADGRTGRPTHKLRLKRPEPLGKDRIKIDIKIDLSAVLPSQRYSAMHGQGGQTWMRPPRHDMLFAISGRSAKDAELATFRIRNTRTLPSHDSYPPKRRQTAGRSGQAYACHPSTTAREVREKG